MKPMIRFRPLFQIALVLLLAGAAQAHPGHEGEFFPTPLRVWSVMGEKAPLAASFVAARTGEVRLRTVSGREVEIALTRLSLADREWVQERRAEIRALNSQLVPIRYSAAVDETRSKPAPVAASAFTPFKEKIKVRWDDRYLYVESDGMPEHPMMKGIRSWQQQVPLPQPYRGANAWRIPLQPVLSPNPISARTGLFRGAIALAANGVPIFNALNNRGEDAYLAGELDEWGGHCGRADDYHYHMAPLHLQKVVGDGKPIGYALDGFPLYGLTNPDGTPVGKLDEFNGKPDGSGGYRYHATLKYPYVNGGLRGVVEVRGDQVEPQPRTTPIRPAQLPLRGALVTGFRTLAANRYRLEYSYGKEKYSMEYALAPDGTVTFDFRDEAGNSSQETYRGSALPRR